MIFVHNSHPNAFYGMFLPPNRFRFRGLLYIVTHLPIEKNHFFLFVKFSQNQGEVYPCFDVCIVSLQCYALFKNCHIVKAGLLAAYFFPRGNLDHIRKKFLSHLVQ